MTHPTGLPQVLTWQLTYNPARRPQKASKPLRLPRVAPACFDSQEQWGRYHVLATISGGNGFTFCEDCTPEYRDKMVAQRRCKFPGTVFTKVNEVIVGERRK